MSNPPLAVFAYAFPHRKTHDFLMELIVGGYRNLCVIAAPWQKLKHQDLNTYFPSNLRTAPAITASDICASFGIPYVEAAHDDSNAIADMQRLHQFNAGIISGARIIRRNVLNLFDAGIVNFHPGSLPETAGLDMFYHTIRTGSRLGITAHFIDHRVDAGRAIFFEETPIGPDDRPDEVQYNNYQSQIWALRRLIRSPNWDALKTTAIDRPSKNDPLSPDEKRRILRRFPAWRNDRHRDQQLRQLLSSCETGDCEVTTEILNAMPSLLNCRSPEGWTPLIVAAYHQQSDCVRLLLSLGADPNATGSKGTTVLMYAKTSILNKPDASRMILRMLIDAGAHASRRDAYGHDIVHYVRQSGDEDLARWLEGRNGSPI